MPLLPNPLATRAGRLLAFFFLYVTEGIPLGFTALAIATQMRREGVPPDAIGIFVATLYLPFAWKWTIGPVVDLVWSNRLGRRRAWIVTAQVAMVTVLMFGVGVDFSAQLKLFTGLVLVVNAFGATQDVAIDSLACAVLHPDERGFANGLMFAGAYLGQAIGGSGVLFLTAWLGEFELTYVFVGACILLVTLFIALPLREEPTERAPREGSVTKSVGNEIKQYVTTALRAFFGSRAALFAAIFGALPCGAYALSLVLQTTLAVELGMDDQAIGTLALFSTIISAAGCVTGGLLSDRFGRRKMLAIYVAATAVPTLLMAWSMWSHDWIMPLDPTDPDRREVPATLVRHFWTLCLVYSGFVGLMYGTRTALFMDVCDPVVAATQFTAYMSLLNIAIAYSAAWQGFAITRIGYPATLAIDAGAGLLCLALLPWIRKRPTTAT